MEGRIVTMEEMFKENGGYVEEVHGEQRYVTSHQGRAVIGPRRHSAKGMLGRLRKRRSARIANSNSETVEVPRSEAPMPDAGVLARLRWAWLTRFYDEQWHKAVQHLGVDLMIWGVGGSVTAVFIKGAWWVISL